ncbi:MAG: hypothetical protein R2734_11175 [Nocardioides sp.]
MEAAAESAIVRQQQELAGLRAVMAAIAEDYESGLERESFVRHPSGDATRQRLTELAAEARHQAVSLNSGRRHTAVSMRASRPLNAAALARGVAIRAASTRTAPGPIPPRWSTPAGSTRQAARCARRQRCPFS